jgi:3-hydroxybutyryl-CoA dehydrogenase
MPATAAIKRVGVIGSGIMGSGIAQCAAASGYEVVVRSRSRRTGDALLAGLDAALGRLVEKGRLSADERDGTLGRISVTDDLGDLAECDLVVESVVEDLAVKKALFAQLDELVQYDAVLATNTSTLPVVSLAARTGRPGQVCGIHFFNPAPVMPLVEIVRPLTASDETMAVAHGFAAAVGKTPVEVQDKAGFIVNALLFPYLNNAVRMLDQGVATREAIDTAMKGGCNFPMGPLALLDLIGLDTSVAVLDALYEEHRDQQYSAIPRLRRMVTAGLLGRKSGRGFYEY